jgi:hypothetical protein
LLATTWNLHTTQPNTLFPTYDEVVNLTGLLETKGMSVSSGKQWKTVGRLHKFYFLKIPKGNMKAGRF